MNAATSALLRLNPELQRGLWLELTPARLVLMPSLLAAGLGGLYLAGVADLSQWDQYIMFFLLVPWGSRLAADSLADEVAQGTWDIQRMSASSPWGLALGKIFGGTAYVWYGTALCLAAFPFLPGAVSGRDVLVTILGGIAAQSAALLVMLVLLGFDRGHRRGSTMAAQLLGIIAGVPSLGSSLAFSLIKGWGERMHWYGGEFSLADFTLAHQTMMMVWLVIGAGWMIRLQLGYRGSPLLYFVFALSQVAFAEGFLFAHGLVPPVAVLSGLAALVLAGLTYVALLASPMAVADVKRLALTRSFSLLPSWGLTGGVAIALGALTVMLGGREWTLAAATLALFVRDIALVGAVRMMARRRTALLLVVLAVLLYGLLPQVLAAVGGDGLRAWMFPEMGAKAITLLGPWGQALAALTLAGLAWSRHRRD